MASSMFTTGTVTVVSAATGHRRLADCVRSVRAQTFPQMEHWIVVDGEERRNGVEGALRDVRHERLRVIVLPEATGREAWCGHRIYGAMSLLVNSEFVCFLDEDNTFEPDHVASLVEAIRATRGGQWAFALRNIVD